MTVTTTTLSPTTVDPPEVVVYGTVSVSTAVKVDRVAPDVPSAVMGIRVEVREREPSGRVAVYGRVSVWVAVTMVGEAGEGEEVETEIELGGVGDVRDAVEGLGGEDAGLVELRVTERVEVAEEDMVVLAIGVVVVVVEEEEEEAGEVSEVELETEDVGMDDEVEELPAEELDVVVLDAAPVGDPLAPIEELPVVPPRRGRHGPGGRRGRVPGGGGSRVGHAGMRCRRRGSGEGRTNGV